MGSVSHLRMQNSLLYIYLQAVFLMAIPFWQLIVVTIFSQVDLGAVKEAAAAAAEALGAARAAA